MTMSLMGKIKKDRRERENLPFSAVIRVRKSVNTLGFNKGCNSSAIITLESRSIYQNTLLTPRPNDKIPRYIFLQVYVPRECSWLCYYANKIYRSYYKRPSLSGNYQTDSTLLRLQEHSKAVYIPPPSLSLMKLFLPG